MLHFKTYHSLPEDAALIRQKVFMEEQGFVDEFDAIDPQADHIVLYDEQQPIATCRYFWDDEQQGYLVGRIAVVKEFRGQALGAAILREAEQQIRQQGGSRLLLAAQVRAKGFYEKQGYAAKGEEFLEEYCPHIWMHKELEQ